MVQAVNQRSRSCRSRRLPSRPGNRTTFLEHYLPAYNFRETERGTEYKRDPDFPILPELWSRHDPDNDERFDDAGETPDTGQYLIYAELDKTQRVTHLALKNRIPTVQTCYAILHEIEARGDFQITWGLADDGYTDTVRISRTTERKP